MLKHAEMTLECEARRARLLSAPSIEVSSRDGAIASALADQLPRGSRVHVTYLPNAHWPEIVNTARALVRAGFDPVPHIAARMIPDEPALNDFLAAATGEGVRTTLLIGGDVDTPRGPFAASMDVLRTGLLQKHGITTIAFAGHPEGHPAVTADVIDRALVEKLAFARTVGLSPEVITQFCFEAKPVVEWIARLRRSGENAPVRVGVAAPTSGAMMMKFAIKCGIGASLNALRKQYARLGPLMGEVSPAALIDDLAVAAAARDLGALESLHCFVFGDVGKAVKWLEGGAH